MPSVSLFVLIRPVPPPPQEEEDDGSSTASDSDVLTQDNDARAEKRPILSVRKSWGSGLARASLWSAGFPLLVERAPGTPYRDALAFTT